MDNEMILFDRLEVIKTTIQKYGEENFYISFSGGKDSTVLHYLVDMALPNNKIPRVFSNTGIEYEHIVKFVRELAEKDERFQIIAPSCNVKQNNDTYGYPFKSKNHSAWVKRYAKNRNKIDPIIEQIENNKELLNDYDFLWNLENGVKGVIAYYFGFMFDTKTKTLKAKSIKCPEKLKFQFKGQNILGISDKCCLNMKEKPLNVWSQQNGKPYTIIGLRRSEGGRRQKAKCLAWVGKKMSFQPLSIITDDWEEWFIKTYEIKLCDLYYPPFNFRRTGCKGCPYALALQKELDALTELLPREKEQCELIWKPVYDEYRRLGYRLRKEEKDG